MKNLYWCPFEDLIVGTHNIWLFDHVHIMTIMRECGKTWSDFDMSLHPLRLGLRLILECVV